MWLGFVNGVMSSGGRSCVIGVRWKEVVEESVVGNVRDGVIMFGEGGNFVREFGEDIVGCG